MSAVAAEKLVAAVLSGKDLLRAKAEWPYEIGLVYLNSLIVDDTYQRPPLHKFVSEMASNFDETLVGAIDVNQRKDGRLAILDGQQRYIAMVQVGKTSCFCSIYRGMTVAEEAGFFYRKNKDRRSMQGYYTFRAQLVAGDPRTKDISRTVEAQGFVVGEGTNEREVIGAIRAVEIAYDLSSEHREECLSPALRTIRESVFGRKGSLDAWLIQGVARFWQAYADGEVEQGAVHQILADFGPTNFLGSVREKQAAFSGAHRVSQPKIVARLLVQEYNRQARGKGIPKLDPSRVAF